MWDGWFVMDPWEHKNLGPLYVKKMLRWQALVPKLLQHTLSMSDQHVEKPILCAQLLEVCLVALCLQHGQGCMSTHESISSCLGHSEYPWWCLNCIPDDVSIVSSSYTSEFTTSVCPPPSAKIAFLCTASKVWKIMLLIFQRFTISRPYVQKLPEADLVVPLMTQRPKKCHQCIA